MRDERDAYRTPKGMLGRSFRRGTKKGITAVVKGLVTGTNPFKHLAVDAAKELPKAYKRSKE